MFDNKCIKILRILRWVVPKVFGFKNKNTFYTSSSVASAMDICFRKTQKMKLDLKTQGGHLLPETT
ncbi:MAG TPA: hypothetical protein DIT10_11190 [Chryseobacterium sp.]|nr:hypothetical protein [Chryseobacterium sp.]